MTDGRAPAARTPGIDRDALLDRLGAVQHPPLETRSWLDRATLPARLPTLLGLDQESSYQLCRRVAAHLLNRRAPR